MLRIENKSNASLKAVPLCIHKVQEESKEYLKYENASLPWTTLHQLYYKQAYGVVLFFLTWIMLSPAGFILRGKSRRPSCVVYDIKCQ